MTKSYQSNSKGTKLRDLSLLCRFSYLDDTREQEGIMNPTFNLLRRNPTVKPSKGSVKGKQLLGILRSVSSKIAHQGFCASQKTRKLQLNAPASCDWKQTLLMSDRFRRIIYTIVDLLLSTRHAATSRQRFYTPDSQSDLMTCLFCQGKFWEPR